MFLNILSFFQYLHDFVFHINLLSLPAYFMPPVLYVSMGTSISGVNPGKYEKALPQSYKAQTSNPSQVEGFLITSL